MGPDSKQKGSAPDRAPGKEIFAWAMYDFANSGYTTVVSTAIYSAYFVEYVASASAEGSGQATLLWAITVAVSNLLIVVTAPVVGAIADYTAAKKQMLAATTIGCILFTALLSLTGPGLLVPAMIAIVLANLMYGTGEDLIAAFLPEISPAEKMGSTSALGWTVGYLGGLATLGLCLIWVRQAEAQGRQSVDFVPETMLITAACFAIAATPTFLFLKERARAQPKPRGMSYLRIGAERLRHTLAQARQFQDLLGFLITLALYSCGSSVVVVLASVYAHQAIGLTETETISLILMVNLSAAAGAAVAGQLQDRIGSVPTLAITLIIWFAAIVTGAAAAGKDSFLLAANLAGAAMGSSQSAGRALIGQLAPRSRSAEFFGLWGLTIKLGTVAGPLSYGLIASLTEGNHRVALAATALFFVAALVSLFTIDEQRGKLAAFRNPE